MPLKKFICPDNETVEISKCLKSCRRKKEGRCMTKSTLIAISKERPPMDHFSTTELLKGPREVWLMRRNDYATDPDGASFRILGSRAHLFLEEDHDQAITEERLKGSHGDSGQIDNYEMEGSKGVLTDYKTWGSYKVALALGMCKRKVPHPDGETYKQSGKWGKAGDVKMVDEFYIDKQKRKCIEAQLQINRYRMKIEEAGFKVDKMQVQAIVRDGNTQVAKQRGIVRNTYLIPIDKLNDNLVNTFFNGKDEEMKAAMKSDEPPRLCNEVENWDGRKCQGYCDVAEFCAKIGDNKWIKGQ